MRYLQAPMQERGEYVSWISSRGEFCYKQDEEYLLAEFKDIKKSCNSAAKTNRIIGRSCTRCLMKLNKKLAIVNSKRS